MTDDERVAEGAQRVFDYAEEEGRRLDHNYVGTEHLLLGLLRDADGMAGRILRAFGVTLEGMRTDVERIVGRGAGGEHAGLTPRMKRVIELAADERRRLGHERVETEHLLLGLVREGEGLAVGMLKEAGVDGDAVRHAVIADLKEAGRIGV